MIIANIIFGDKSGMGRAEATAFFLVESIH